MAGLQKHLEGKYEVLAGLEDGPGGDVYKVRHLFLDEVRLIRVVHLSTALSAETRERLLQAARAAIRLHHPNIAQLHDFALEDDGSAVIVSEYVEGPTWEEAIEDLGPLPAGLALPAAQQALHALAHLHRGGGVHGDISPDKLKLLRDGDQPLAKWIDLGLDGILAAGDGFQSGPMFPAKPRYAAPERFSASQGDSRSDLYSFGVVLYEMLTGRCPVAGHDAFSFMAGHLYTPPLDFAESDPLGNLPSELREIVLRTIEKRPEDRFQSADEMARRLAALQERLPAAGTEHLERALKINRQRSGLRAPADLRRTLVLPAAAASGASTLVLLPAAVPPLAARSAPPPPLTAPAAPAGEDAWADRTLGYSTVVRSPLAAPPSLPAAPPAPQGSAASARPNRWWPLAAAALLLLALGGVWFGLRNRSNPEARNVTAPREGQPAAQAEPGETVDIGDVPLPERIEEEPAPQPSTPISGLGDERKRLEPQAKAGQDAPPPPPAGTRDPNRFEIPFSSPGGPMKRGDMIADGPGVEHAEPVSIGEPAYPAVARGSGKSARVKVAVLVDENGNVIQARIRESDIPGYGFNEAALAAARRARFLPATRDGIPGKGWTELQYDFNPPASLSPEPQLDTKPFETEPAPVPPPGL